MGDEYKFAIVVIGGGAITLLGWWLFKKLFGDPPEKQTQSRDPLGPNDTDRL